MATRTLVSASALICSLLVSAPASAGGPDDEAAAGTEIVDPGPAVAAPEAPEAVVVGAETDAMVGPAPAIEPTVIDIPAPDPAPVDEDHYEPEIADPYDDPLADDYHYESRRTTLELDSGYIGMGIAPGMTLYNGGFHPNTRFELEFGGTLEHRYRDLALSFGVATHLTPYYERKKPSFGADVIMTAILGPVYLRTGLGALGGLPRQHLLHNTTAGIGGVVGAGLTFGRAPMIRVGVDYDLRVNTKMEPVHTVFLAVRIACCRED